MSCLSFAMLYFMYFNHLGFSLFFYWGLIHQLFGPFQCHVLGVQLSLEFKSLSFTKSRQKENTSSNVTKLRKFFKECSTQNPTHNTRRRISSSQVNIISYYYSATKVDVRNTFFFRQFVPRSYSPLCDFVLHQQLEIGVIHSTIFICQ